MSAIEFKDANERIERLEKKLRRQTQGVLVLAILVVASVSTSALTGQTAARRTVEAEEFILRGPQGQELATLNGLGKGASLILYDSQHHARIVLTTHDDTEPAIVVFGSDLKSALSIGAKQSNPYLQLDERGRTRADLVITESGPAMRMWDSNGNMLAVTAVHNDVPSVSVSNGPDPKKGSVILSATDEGGQVLITGMDGKLRDVMR